MPPPALVVEPLGEDMPPPVPVVEPLGVDEPSVARRLIAPLVGVVGVEISTPVFFGCDPDIHTANLSWRYKV